MIGGVGTYTFDLARTLAKLGHQVYLITQASELEGEFLEEGVFVSRVKPVELWFLSLLKGWLPATCERLEYSFAVSRKLRQLVKEHGIEIVESCEARFEGFWYYLFHRKPHLAVKLHTPESIVFKIDRIPANLDVRIKDALETWWMLTAHALIPVTHAIADLVAKHYKIKPSRIPPTYYPVDSEQFCPSREKLSNPHPKILYVGRLEIRKGVLDLLEAIPLVLKEFPAAHFSFVGGDAGVRYLMDRRIPQLGCAKSMTFVDQVKREDMVKYYQEADLCVFPSLWENFAFVALEAMACGKTVVATRVGGFVEMIEDGVTGVLCDPEDPADLAAKIIQALKDRKQNEKMGKAARKKIVETCSMEKRAELMVEIYRSLL
ncbi:MAG: glycosyltransferase family 4 protein [Candidatus Omnitrophica bacterium]|nr:glycosyltransferase family 4 protein [Candidatus Omnitrophota bacterium]